MALETTLGGGFERRKSGRVIYSPVSPTGSGGPAFTHISYRVVSQGECTSNGLLRSTESGGCLKIILD